MKLISTRHFRTCLLSAVLLITGIGLATNISAQVCSDPVNTIYGLSGAGNIYPIDVTTASVGVALNPAYTGNAPSSANALGYDPANGKFYYFKRNADQTPQEFVSFDPLTNLVTILSGCPTTYSVNTGCVSFDGTGFFVLDANADLFKYDILTDTWILITGTFYDQYGTDITGVLRVRNSGDLALDGFGNLWMLCSSASQYGLYEFNGPLPTGFVASLTGKEIISPSTLTPTGKNFAGIAFNTTGQIYVSGGTGDNRLYRLENNLTLTYLGTLTINGAGRDLTSCNFPFGILPLTWERFSATLKNNHDLLLNWTVGQQINNLSFYIENSQNGSDWKEVGYVNAAVGYTGSGNYAFNVLNPINGNQYYRIRQTDLNGKSTYSEIRMISVKNNSQVAIWPNPSRDYILIHNENAFNDFRVQLFDLSGRMVNETVLSGGLNTVSISSLPLGAYIVKVQLTNGETYNQKLLKN